MTLQQLKYVQAVARERHFGRAAEACRVSQSTLSMQIKKLESLLGSPLFDRTASPLALTTVGSRVLQTALNMTVELDDLAAWLTQSTERLDGKLTMAVLPTIAPALLPMVMPAVTAHLPQLEIQLLERTTADMVVQLSEGTIDVGILSTPLDVAKLRTVPLYMEPLHAYVHPDHPSANIPSGQLEAKDLPPESMLLLEEGHCFRAQALQMCASEERGCQLGYRCESGSIETLKRLVRESGGCTLIPGLEALANPDDIHLRTFCSPEPAREISLVVRPNWHREALLHELKTLLTEAVPRAYRHTKPYKRLSWENVSGQARRR